MLRWIDDQQFVIGDTTFLTLGDRDWNDKRFLAAFMRLESTAHRFVLWKSRVLVDQYVQLVQSVRARNIFELGIMQGGSTAFVAAIAQPQKLVAIDIAANEVEALKEFVDQQKLAKRVRTYYGVDQADRKRVKAMLDDEFAGAQLDLVIDDASHRLDSTRASFNTLFPRLRPGGVYVIEDWPWAHTLDAADLAALGDIGPPLTNLLFEIVVACATYRNVVDKVEIDWGAAYIRRGAGAIGADFDVARPFAAAREQGLDGIITDEHVKNFLLKPTDKR
jgi:predicted O-methyltransferase YrrM